MALVVIIIHRLLLVLGVVEIALAPLLGVLVIVLIILVWIIYRHLLVLLVVLILCEVLVRSVALVAILVEVLALVAVTIVICILIILVVAMLLLVHLAPTLVMIRLLEAVALILTVLVLIVPIAMFLLVLVALPVLVPARLVSLVVGLVLRLWLSIFRSVIVVWLVRLELGKCLLWFWGKCLSFRFHLLRLIWGCKWLRFRSERGLIHRHRWGLRTCVCIFLWLEWLCIFGYEWFGRRSKTGCRYFHWCRFLLRIIHMLLYIRRLGVRYLLRTSALVHARNTLSLGRWWVRLTSWFITDLILLRLFFLFLYLNHRVPTTSTYKTLERRFSHFVFESSSRLFVEAFELLMVI